MTKTTNSPADEYILYRVTLDVAVPIMCEDDKKLSAIDYIDAVRNATILGTHEEKLCLKPARTVVTSYDAKTSKYYPPHDD